MATNKLATYSGVSTKIRAMSVNLITNEQFNQISNFKRVEELIAFLQTNPSYSKALAHMDPSMMRRSEFEKRMHFSTFSDFSKIYHFVGKKQKQFLNFFFKEYETALLKVCIRNILDYRVPDKIEVAHDFFERLAPFDLDEVTSAKDMDSLIDCLKETEYYEPLMTVHAIDNPTLFDYEMGLDLFFFKYIWEKKHDFVPRGEMGIFDEAFGSKIDLLNILWVYRCKVYYNITPSQIYSFLIPIHFHIAEETLKSLVDAEDMDAFYDTLSNTHFGNEFGFNPEISMESQFGDYMYQINQTQFKKSPYSIACINSFFYLKNLEVSRVITAMECIRYGYEPEKILEFVNKKRGVL